MVVATLLRLRSVAVILLCAHAHMSQAQQVYVCKGADGRQEYRQSPCHSGAEVSSTWSKQRDVERAREEARKAEEEKKAKEQSAGIRAKRREQIGDLRRCAADWDCSLSEIRYIVVGMFQIDLTEALGPPSNVQSGSTVYWYYTMAAEEAGARRRVRLQLTFSARKNEHGVVAPVVDSVDFY